MEAAKNSKLRFRVGDLDPPEKGKRYISSRVGGKLVVQNCPCGKAMESTIHIAAERPLHEELRGMLEREMREANEGGMQSFEAVDSSKQTMAFLGDR